MCLVREIAHGLAGLNPVEELRVGRKLPSDGAAEQLNADPGFQLGVHVPPLSSDGRSMIDPISPDCHREAYR
jgi:hypothetical protein